MIVLSLPAVTKHRGGRKNGSDVALDTLDLFLPPLSLFFSKYFLFLSPVSLFHSFFLSPQLPIFLSILFLFLPCVSLPFISLSVLPLVCFSSPFQSTFFFLSLSPRLSFTLVLMISFTLAIAHSALFFSVANASPSVSFSLFSLLQWCFVV